MFSTDNLTSREILQIIEIKGFLWQSIYSIHYSSRCSSGDGTKLLHIPYWLLIAYDSGKVNLTLDFPIDTWNRNL